MVNLDVISVNNGESDELALITHMAKLRAELNHREITYRRAGR